MNNRIHVDDDTFDCLSNHCSVSENRIPNGILKKKTFDRYEQNLQGKRARYDSTSRN
jgi:hypothetical protein